MLTIKKCKMNVKIKLVMITYLYSKFDKAVKIASIFNIKRGMEITMPLLLKRETRYVNWQECKIDRFSSLRGCSDIFSQ